MMSFSKPESVGRVQPLLACLVGVKRELVFERASLSCQVWVVCERGHTYSPVRWGRWVSAALCLARRIGMEK